MKAEIKTVVIFHRLGPYHFARLRAAGRELPVVAIETSGTDETYAWDKIAGAEGFEQVTLFADADAQSKAKREVQSVMAAALDKIKPEVVVVPGWADSAALGALQWCARNRVPSVVMSDSTAWDEIRKPWKEWVKRRIVGLFSAGLVAGQPHADYLNQLGLARERIFLGYDAVDNGYFARSAKEVRSKNEECRMGDVKTGKRKAESGNQYGLPKNYFLASARFIEKKNLPRLIAAYALYRKKSEVRSQESKVDKSEIGKRKAEVDKSEIGNRKSEIWDLVLLGDGALRSSLESQISSLKLQHCVHLPGFKQYPELPEYYARAGAFIHASTTEQWGLVVNEAMASGLPVLVSNRCGCARDLVQEGVNGFTFDPYNVEQLAELMLKISAMASSSPPRSGRGIQGEVSNAPDQLSTFNFQPSTTLEQMGQASQRIIADWGPERFATGLKSAVRKAVEVGPIKPTWLQRLILKALLAR